MKIVALLAAAGLALTSCGRPEETPANTMRVVDRTQTFRLSDCGGTLQANLSNTNQVSVVVRGSDECSNVTFRALGQTESYKIPESGNGRTGSFTVPSRMIQRDGSGTVEVTVHSNSHAHSDKVTISYDFGSDHDLIRNDTLSLSECGGSVNIKAWSNGQRELTFKNVRYCSNVIINYFNEHKLSGENQNFYGTIKFRGGLFAGITVRSNSGEHADRLTVFF